jgi:lipid II:glycine glycyltransferase (peptidoglycan interpeptide bridge formation enzyme)
VPLGHYSEEDTLAALRSNTRRHIRSALRSGLTVRIGEEADVTTLQRLLEDTGRRQDFAVYPEAHHRCLWRTFAWEHAVLLLAEREGMPVAANLVVGFGDSAVFKVGAWDGSEAAAHPNELLHWHGMRWARERGHAFYDLEGISLPAARALRAGESLPESTSGVTRFKARFAGEVVLLPGTHDLTYPTLLGRALRRLAPAAQRWHGLAHRVVGRRA